MTNDAAIIDNAAATALNQEDLATLIQMNYKTIYLCNENFNVPIRVAGVRYVEVLSTPKIKIRASEACEKLFRKGDYEKLKNFLEIAKTF